MTPAQRLSPLDALIPQPAVAVDEAFMENDKKPTHTDTDDHTCCVDEAGRKGRCILDGVSRTQVNVICACFAVCLFMPCPLRMQITQL